MTQIILWSVIGCAICATLWFVLRKPHDRRELVISILHTIPRSFLVVSTHESLAFSSEDSGNLLLGHRNGQAVINMRTHWGIDIARINAQDVQMDGHQVTVTIPVPEVLDSVPDLSSWRYVGKRSGLQALKDGVRGRSLEIDLLRNVHTAQLPLRESDAQTQRTAIVDRLNRDAAKLFDATGLSVTFK